MQNKGIKSIIIITIVSVIIGMSLIITGLAVKKSEFNKYPQGGLYFAKADSCYSYVGKKENPLITLTCFEVKKDNFKDLVKYKDISLVDKDKKQYKAKDVSIAYVFSDMFISRIRIQIVIDRNDIIGDITLNNVRLTDEKGDYDYSIGNIEIITLDNADNYSSVNVSGYTTTSKEFNSYTTMIINNSNKNITLKDVELKLKNYSCKLSIYDTYGNVYDFDGYLIKAKSSVYIRIDFINNTDNKYIFNYVKPSIIYEIEDKEYAVSVNGTAEYLSYMDRQDIAEYLNKGL